MREVTFDVIGKCNSSCIHCGFEEPLEGTLRNAPDPSFENCKKAFQSFKNLDIQYLHLLGGEPTVREDLPDLIAEAKKFDLIVGLTTNGRLLDHKLFSNCVESGLNRIVLSIDSPIKEKNDHIRGKGSFEAAINCANVIKQYKKDHQTDVYFSVSCQMTAFLLDYIPEMFELCHSLNVDELNIKKVRNLGRARDTWELLNFDNQLSFQICEQIAIEASAAKFNVAFPFKLIANHYFNKTNGLSNTRFPSPCTGGDSSFHCFLDGTLAPCMAYPRYRPELTKIAPSAFSPISRKEFEETPYLANFRKEFQGNHQLIKKFEPCHECPFAGEICFPCPLELLDNSKGFVPICAIAMDKLKRSEEKSTIEMKN